MVVDRGAIITAGQAASGDGANEEHSSASLALTHHFHHYYNYNYWHIVYCLKVCMFVCVYLPGQRCRE